MKFFKPVVAAAICAVAATPNLRADDEPLYMRSSIYTILVKSDAQNQRLETEARNLGENEFLAVGKAFANTDAKRNANDTILGDVKITAIPALRFSELPIPNQFNDHCLAQRILDFDPMRAAMSDSERKELMPANAKKSGNTFKAIGGGLLGAVTGQSQSTMVRADEVDDYMAPVLVKYFRDNNVAAQMVAKWFGYDAAADQHWDQGLSLINTRGLQNASAEDLSRAAVNSNDRAILAGKGLDLIGNTYVVAVNLRYRNNKAVAAEAGSMAKGLFGSIGSVADAIGQASVGDGYTVQAVTQLYKLDWDNDLSVTFAEEFFDKNATLDDLAASGLFKLSYVGQEKSSASVRQSMFSTKPISELIYRATGRSVDAAIAKLQQKNEVFRTIVPISSVDGEGNIYAKIGMKEGLSKGDVYQILEPQEDESGRITYKQVGTVKVDGKQIWNNLFGAEDEAAENLANNKTTQEDEAIAFGATRFTGAKKGQDYSGYLLRLSKKK